MSDATPEPIHTGSMEPKLVTVLREGYSLHQFGGDVIAGLVSGWWLCRSRSPWPSRRE